MANQIPLTVGQAVLDEDANAADGWLVACELHACQIETTIPRSRRALCIHEPSPMTDLPESFVNQFGLLISPHLVPGFTGNWYQTHSGLPWFFGATMGSGGLTPTLTHRELKNLPLPEKSKSVSVVVSSKVFHSGHRRRLRLLEVLRERLGDRLQIFGRGIRDIDDKADAILPSELHLSLENTAESSYWSEKLADAFLGYALPVYGGCTDIHRWFPEDSMVIIDPNDAEGTCETIERALAEDWYQQRLPAICDARARLFDHETTFHVISRAIEAFPSDEPNLRKPTQLFLPGRGGFGSRLTREARRIFFQLTFRSKLKRSA